MIPGGIPEGEIERIERESGGAVSFAARLPDGEIVERHSDRRVQAASTIKLPILIHAALSVREGAASWDERVSLQDADKVGGSGVLRLMGAGLSLTLRDLCMLMIVISDNTATNMVVERLGGVEPLNDRIRALGPTDTVMFRKLYSQGPPISPDNAQFGVAMTTPRDMLSLLGGLVDATIGDAALCEELLGILAEQQLVNNIPRALPDGWRYAGKTGSLDHVRNDVGVVTDPEGERTLLALFCQSIPVIMWTADNPGHVALVRLTRHILGPGGGAEGLRNKD
jgi:beta-lactamase class A